MGSLREDGGEAASVSSSSVKNECQPDMVCVQNPPRSSSSTSRQQKRTSIRRKETKKELPATEFPCLRAVLPAASSSDLQTVLAAIQYIHHLQSQLAADC